MNAPRVVHLVYDLIRGGTEGQCARIAAGLAKQGLPHRVAVFHRRGFFLDAVETACGPVREVAIRHLVRMETLREMKRLADWLRCEKADLLHAWDADAAIFGQWAARRAGVRLVTSRRDLGQIYPAHKSYLMRWADRRAVQVVTNAEAVRAQFVRQGLPAGKVTVLPNLLDLEEFDRQFAARFSMAERLPAGRRLVVVSRLDPEKNTGRLIEALPWVRRAIPDAVLVIAGDGKERPVLQSRAAALGVKNEVVFLGAVTDVPGLLAQCEAGALIPSHNEGLSNTILEYMAAGRPVLATDCGGSRELIRDGETGRLVMPTASIAEVAAAWVALLQDRPAGVEMGRTGRAWVERCHSPEVVLPSFAEFYARVGRRA